VVVTIFHIAHAADWDAALAAGEYRVSTRGLGLDEVGFIHASTAAQVAGVAGRFYRDDAEPLVVLVLDESLIDVPVRWEDGGTGELFPHLYGPIRPGFVTAIVPASFGADGDFSPSESALGEL
jgi:uncharacterized protein (DUF952 family)